MPSNPLVFRAAIFLGLAVYLLALFLCARSPGRGPEAM
jgi:hypothetical protein